MQSWVKIVPTAEVKDGAQYFIGKIVGPGVWLHARGLNGKLQWSEKPGIAIRCEGSDKFRAYLAENTGCVAVEVPADADKRWRARKRRS